MTENNKKDCCEIFQYDKAKVDQLRDTLKDEGFTRVTSIFKALADETRIKIAYMLCLEEKLCVCDVATIIGASTATTSHHLRLLKNNGVAKSRKEGKLVFYSIDDEHVKQLVMNAIEHTRH